MPMFDKPFLLFPIHQPMFRHLFELRSRTTVIGIRIDRDASTRSKDSRDFDIFGVHQFNKVFHDDIDTILMESPVPHRRPLHHPARCAPRHFGEQNAVRRHRKPARGHRLCSARGESARRRRPLRQGARDLSGDRNDKIPPRREGGRAREVRASTKEGRRRRGEGKRT